MLDLFFSYFWKVFFWVFGVITCAFYAVVTELICSQTSYLWALFAPLLIIPVANALVLLTDVWKNPGRRTLAVLGTLNGIALIVSSLLALVLSPLCLLACVGLAIGIAYIFFAPAFVGLAIAAVSAFHFFVAVGPVMTASSQRRKLRRFLPKEGKAPWLPISTCIAMVISFILIAVFPTALTRTCSAAIADGSGLQEGLLLLRAVGNSDELLRACYSEEGALPWFFQWAGGVYNPFFSADNLDALKREIYYRVKGRPFNSVPRPVVKQPSSFFNDDLNFNYYYYDNDRDFAGETVGGIARGLSLSKSSIGGWIDPDQAVAHLSWSMRFHGASQGKELRAQILLPPHAVIGQCSLWVNGVKRDAVVATRKSSRQAYTTAAFQGEKPLLVSTAGAGRVLLQSSTGWWGSDADLTVEITAPLVILGKDKAALPLPMFTERNFSVPASHLISLTSSKPAYVTNNALSVKHVQSSLAEAEITGKLSNSDLTSGSGTIILQRDRSVESLVAEDPADGNKDILQQIQAQKFSAETPLVVVVDGSSTMADWTGKICQALKKIRFKNATIVWASDVPRIVVSRVDTTSPQWAKALDTLQDSSCLGGQNNAEALSLAMTQLGCERDASIVWLHGPQPVAFTGDTLLPLLSGTQRKIGLYEYQLVTGPNEVIKSLDQTSALVQVPHIGTPAEDLNALFRRLSGQIDSFVIDRHYIAHGSAKMPIARHSAEIAQLYIGDLVLANLSNWAERTAYGTMAERHHLVTPLTSAVVLEHEADYKAYGVTKHSELGSKTDSTGNTSQTGLVNTHQLIPLAGGSIPATPEPPMSLLVCCALLMVVMLLWMKRRRKEHA